MKVSKSDGHNQKDEPDVVQLKQFQTSLYDRILNPLNTK